MALRVCSVREKQFFVWSFSFKNFRRYQIGRSRMAEPFGFEVLAVECMVAIHLKILFADLS
jgi:hypothetical protein